MPYTNTLKVFEKLRPAFDEKQATAVAEAIDEALETNNDVAFDKLDARFKSMEDRFDSKLNALEARMDAKIAELRAELIKWMFLFWVGQVAVVFAIVKFVR